jgi:hypothetical protein
VEIVAGPDPDIPFRAMFETVAVDEGEIFAEDIKVLGSGGGRLPPERKDGHNERSSGNDEDVGER